MNRHITLECSQETIMRNLNRYDEDGYDLVSFTQTQPAQLQFSEFDTKEWKTSAQFLLIFRKRA